MMVFKDKNILKRASNWVIIEPPSITTCKYRPKMGCCQNEYQGRYWIATPTGAVRATGKTPIVRMNTRVDTGLRRSYISFNSRKLNLVRMNTRVDTGLRQG